MIETHPYFDIALITMAILVVASHLYNTLLLLRIDRREMQSQQELDRRAKALEVQTREIAAALRLETERTAQVLVDKVDEQTLAVAELTTITARELKEETTREGEVLLEEARNKLDEQTDVLSAKIDASTEQAKATNVKIEDLNKRLIEQADRMTVVENQEENK